MSAFRRRLSGVATSFGWYPLLLSLVWFLEAYTVARVEPAAALRALVIAVAVPVVLTVAGILLLGKERGTLVAALLLVALIAVRSPILALPFLAAVVLLLVERRWARQGRLSLPWQRIHETLSVLVGVMLVVQVVRLATFAEPAPVLASTAWAAQPLDGSGRPDIYLVLADAHGRGDVLAEQYGLDNQPFLAGLEAMGFDVAYSSRANYFLTRFSLGSMLSASYLDGLDADATPAAEDDLARRTIHDNPAFPLLRQAGYEITVVSSGYEHLGLRSADRFVDTGQPNEFESMLLENVAASGVLGLVAPGHADASIRDRTHDELAALLSIAAQPAGAPRFVLAHLPVPHWPYVFSETCEPSSWDGSREEGIGRGGGDAQAVAAVRAQTQCVDRLLTDSLGALVQAAPDAIVILFSDHGPDEHLDWWNPDAPGLTERSANLFAARTPGRPGLFADDITLVNVLPTLFNAYLGTSLSIQPDQVWFGPRPQDHTFVKVTP